MEKYTLKNLDLFKENDCYYLSARYLYENDDYEEEIDIPYIKLPFETYKSVNIIEKWNNGHITMITIPEYRLHIGNVSFPIEQKNGIAYTSVRTKDKKKKKLTVSEIEKKLGYKIEIVSEKEKEND